MVDGGRDGRWSMKKYWSSILSESQLTISQSTISSHYLIGDQDGYPLPQLSEFMKENLSNHDQPSQNDDETENDENQPLPSSPNLTISQLKHIFNLIISQLTILFQEAHLVHSDLRFFRWWDKLRWLDGWWGEMRDDSKWDSRFWDGCHDRWDDEMVKLVISFFFLA